MDAALEHILRTVLAVSDGSPLDLALKQNLIESVPAVLALSVHEINGLKYNRTERNKEIRVPLPTGHISLLLVFKAYIKHLRDLNKFSKFEDIEKSDFEDFQLYTYDPEMWFNAATSATASTPSSASTAPTTPSPRQPSALAEFQKGIKRNKADYTELKDDKQWDGWRRATIATARSHGCEVIFDSSFVPDPSDADAYAVFKEKQKFMYSVFEEKLKTDFGRHLVREHEADFDAHTIYKELSDHARKSTQAAIDSSELLSYITTTRMSNDRWRGTAKSFILHWCDKLRLYEDLVEASDRFTDNVKMAMLQNAVSGIAALHQVKTTAAHEIARGGTALTYQQYKTLLLSAAATYDEKRGPMKLRSGRVVFNHELDFEEEAQDSFHMHALTHDITEIDQNEDAYDIDTDVSTLQAQAHDFRRKSTKPFGPSMPRDVWKSLSEKEQQAWDTMSSQSKAAILALKSRSSQTSQAHTSAPSPNRSVNVHESNDDVEDDPDEPNDNATDSQGDEGESTRLVQFATTQTASPGDIRRVLSSQSSRSSRPTSRPPIRSNSNSNNISNRNKEANEVVIDGKRYRQINMHERVTYNVSNHKASKKGSLVDRGANGGLAGDDVRIINKSDRFVDVSGIDHHCMSDLPIVTAGAVVNSQRGPVIAIMHQYAYIGSGKSIHSSGQLEWFKNDVNDRSMKVKGGLQRIETNDGYVHPLNIKNGLPYVSMRPYTDDEWEELPHVVWTSDVEWNPSVLDHEIEDEDEWYDAITDMQEGIIQSPFDEFGNYRKREVDLHFFDAEQPPTIDDVIDHAVFAGAHETKTKEPDYEALRPLFLWAPVETIKQTFKATTQFARMPVGRTLRHTYKSPFPALNVFRRNEPVATDTVYSDVPAIDGGETCAQIYVGRDTLVTDVYGMKTDKQFVNTLEDNIRKRGAMDKLISDRAQVEIGKRSHDIMRAYCIDDWQSEPGYQHQNFAERRYNTVKESVNILLNRTGAPAYTWLLALLYVVFILNLTAVESIGWVPPLQRMTGQTKDISVLLSAFKYWEPVYYTMEDSKFPSDSTEKRGRFVGFAENVGHALTYKVLTDDTKKVIYRSRIRSALTESERNLRVDPPDVDKVPDVVKSKHEYGEGKMMPTIDPSSLIGRTFLLDPKENGERHRAKIVEAIIENDKDVANSPGLVKFRCTVNDEEYEDIVTYNDIMSHIEKDQTEEGVWKFKSITAHQGPLNTTDANYMGSKYNVLVNWETGESTFEPLHVIAADDPVTCAIYAKDNNLLDKEGWKRFKNIAKRQKKLLRLVNQAKLKSFRRGPIYMFGFRVPRNHEEAMELDRKNGNTRWKDAEKVELTQIDDYDTFTDYGKGGKPPDGYKKIRVHFVYAVKHDGRHKARLVAGGHLTDTPVDSVYSSVVSLRGLRLIVFLSELNDLELWSTDVGNAYLEAKTKEKVYIVAGPEFGEREGHTLVIHKALYGLRSSGLRFREKLADSLRDMGFVPSKAEDDIWMRQNGAVWEYIATYVDDLCIAAKNPQAIVDFLEKDCKYKLKGTGPIKFHLGCDFFRDEDGVLCFAPKRYIDKMIDTYERLFGCKPKPYTSPLEKGDHPELDMSEELDEDGVKKYQSLVGAMQWAVSLGRIDITTAVMTMSGFRTAPRKGHMERCQRIYGYLSKMKHAVIRVRTEEPDYSDVPEQQFDWAYTVYGNVEEAIPADLPTPLGKPVVLTTYVDANLYHDWISGRSVTGILHLINKMPFDWYSKKQSTVETATYGSEFSAARVATDQIMDSRQTLRYLGVPVRQTTYLFGDNRSVVDSSFCPHAKLHKRHTALSFHRVREAVAAKVINFQHIAGALNPADILSKHWGYQQVWPTLQAVLFWKGDTMDLYNRKEGGKEEGKSMEE